MRLLGHDLVQGLIATAGVFGHYTAEYRLLMRLDTLDPAGEDRPGPMSGPPPGHPERVVPHSPPSDEERDLWTRLRG
jgi:hypothetical protein